MHSIFNALILIHIVVGSVGLASFWVPVFARKRRGLHTQAGRVFAYAMMATATSAAVAATLTLIDPLGTHPETSSRYEDSLRAFNGLMLLYLSVITFSAAFSGLRAVRLKARYGGHRERVEIAVNLLGFVLAAGVMVIGLQRGSALMIGLSLIGLLGTPGNLKMILSPAVSPREWKYQHMSSMLGAGIAAHTAFFVFGAGRFVDSALSSSPLVWLAPTILGVPATMIWVRWQRRRDGGVRTASPGAKPSLEVSS